MSEDKKVPFEVTAWDVESGISELAKKRPGVYERRDGSLDGCVNVELIGGEKVPSCIVGSYFAMRVGVENVEQGGNVGSTIYDLTARGLITVTPEARYMLAVAQKLQDTRKVSWSAIADTIFGLRMLAMNMHEELNGSEW